MLLRGIFIAPGRRIGQCILQVAQLFIDCALFVYSDMFFFIHHQSFQFKF